MTESHGRDDGCPRCGAGVFPIEIDGLRAQHCRGRCGIVVIA